MKDKLLLGTVFIVLIGLVVLIIWVYASAFNAVYDAKTPQELRQACSGFSIKNAPIECLQLTK